jgi:hypothetical protein
MDERWDVPIALGASLAGGMVNPATAHDDAVAKVMYCIGYRFIG